MNFLRRFMTRLQYGTDLTPSATEPQEEGVYIIAEAVNPFLSTDEADLVFEQLTGWMNVLWPVVEAANNLAVPVQIGQAGVASILDTFTADDVEAETGVLFELVRLARTFLPDDQDADDMPGTRDKREYPEGVIDIRPELAAFFDAAFRDEWTQAVQVGVATRKRAREVFEDRIEPEQAGSVGVQFFAAAVLMNVARQWSLINQAEHLASVQTDG